MWSLLNRVRSILMRAPSSTASLHSSASSSSGAVAPLPASYTRPLHRVKDLALMHDFIERHSFASLTCVKDGTPVVSHVPFMLEKPMADADSNGQQGFLECHIARVNPMYQMLVEAAACEREVLVVFTGPHGYISPQFYLPQIANVPTWDYTAVHAYAVPVFEPEDADAAPPAMPGLASLDKLVAVNEARYMRDFIPHDGSAPGRPWTTAQMPASKIEGQRRMIVGARLRITRLYGKSKLSQNKPDVVVEQVIQGLRSTGQADLAAVMEEDLHRRKALRSHQEKEAGNGNDDQ